MPKLDLNRIEMPRQDPKVRATNFNEVALGYSQEQAIKEAGRCIQCKKRNCTAGCPVEVDIPDFIKALREGNLPEAVKVLKNKNALPGIWVGSVLRNPNASLPAHWINRARRLLSAAWKDSSPTGNRPIRIN